MYVELSSALHRAWQGPSCVPAAALVVIFLPLIESRKIFAAALGFGPLARRNKHKTAAAQDVITLDMPPAGKEQLPNGKEGTGPADAGHESPIKV